VKSKDFSQNKSQKRIWRQNKDIKIDVMEAYGTSDQFELLKKYLLTRHSTGGMAEMDEFEYAEMVDSSPVKTTLVEYREPPRDDDNLNSGKLIGAALTDVLSDGFSMVYSFFDPDSKRKSLGTFIIIDHIERAKAQSLPYVYLGYWVKGSSKMDYKDKFQPLERLSTIGWKPD
jgi:arginine-tRNA-protein transferase